jgi:hypothetical protein
VLETALVGAVAAGALLPRIVTFEVALLGGAQADLPRARLAALEREFDLFSSAYDAAEAPPTPVALALPSAADSPKDVSFFPAIPTPALLGPAASAPSKGHGPSDLGPLSSLARGNFSTSSDYIVFFLIPWSLPPRYLPFRPSPRCTRPCLLLSAAALQRYAACHRTLVRPCL